METEKLFAEIGRLQKQLDAFTNQMHQIETLRQQIIKRKNELYAKITELEKQKKDKKDK